MNGTSEQHFAEYLIYITPHDHTAALITILNTIL